MNLPNPKDAKHKAWLYRVLTAIYDNIFLARVLRFKGGTCAVILGLLDRFSVDLNFDFVGEKSDFAEAHREMEKIFRRLGLSIKDRSRNVPQYFLQYSTKQRERNMLKIDVAFPATVANQYEAKRFTEIDRIITCQTTETMFANKLVALLDRYKKNNSIAGRDVYDIHHFFENGFRYNEAVILERTGLKAKEFFMELIAFIEEKVSDEFIAQDLNSLVPYARFRLLHKVLKREALMFLRDEAMRLDNGSIAKKS